MEVYIASTITAVLGTLIGAISQSHVESRKVSVRSDTVAWEFVNKTLDRQSRMIDQLTNEKAHLQRQVDDQAQRIQNQEDRIHSQTAEISDLRVEIESLKQQFSKGN